MTKRLTEMVRNCGCAAKLGPGVLSELLGSIKNNNSEDLLIGFEHSDDAAAFRIDDDKILLQTLDFFPPIVDNPYTFGQIAAANALSDIYAMGGCPLTAMNIVCFPEKEVGTLLPEILKGGADKVFEAGAVIVGGHSVDDLEPKYGLSVTGITDIAHLRGNCHAQEGDLVVLTKPIGTGIIISAIKGGIVSDAAADAAIESMVTLNKAACEAMNRCEGIHGCTDVTGFSLAGHAIEMAKASGLTMILETREIPLLPEAVELASMGIIPAGTYRNRDYFAPDYQWTDEPILEDLLFDPQTSGGLLISVAADKVDDLLKALETNCKTDFAVVGRLIAKQQKALKIS